MKDKSHLDSDDIIETDEEGSEAASAAKLKKLREALKKCEAERGEYLAGWQRAKADYINLKQTEEKGRQEVIRYAKEDLLHDLIDLADSFELAFANKEAWEQAPANWRQGVEYIYNNLTTLLERNGLTTLDSLGREFNPEEHHSLGLVETERSSDDNKVLAVVKKGYRLNGKVVRPAQVKVGVYKK